MALLKLSASIIRVAERVLGLTGTPLPTELNPAGVTLVTEMRAVRFFEEYDEGIIRWWGIFQAAAIAGQLSTIQFNTRLAAANINDNLRGGILTVEKIIPQSPVAATLALAVSDADVVAPAFQAAAYRDARWGPGVTALLAVQAAIGQANPSGAIIATIPDRVAFDADWAAVLNTLSFRPGDVIALRGQAVNLAITAYVSGRLVLAK